MRGNFRPGKYSGSSTRKWRLRVPSPESGLCARMCNEGYVTKRGRLPCCCGARPGVKTFAVLLMLAVAPVFGQVPVETKSMALALAATQETNGICNGRWWLGHSDFSVRMAYVRGLGNGLSAVDGKSFALFIPDMTYAEIEKAVDAFYQDPFNGPFPVLAALQIIKFKAEGATAAQIEDLLRI